MLGLRVSRYEPNTRMAPHHHECCSFCVVVSGSYRERIRDQNAEHGKGHMVFYPAGELHSQEFGVIGPQKIIFTPHTSSLEFLLERGVALSNAPAVYANTLSVLASRVLSEARSPDQFTDLAIQGLLLEMIAVFARRDKSKRSVLGNPLWLCNAQEILRESKNNGLTIEMLAKQVGKHPVHLAREFRKHFGQTIGEYQRHLRLRKAEMLLGKKNISLTEVAFESGFCSQSHLSRSFKNAYGVTPSKYRLERL